MAALDTSFSACGLTQDVPLFSVSVSQEAGRLDNYRHPQPIQMSIKLFRAWHYTPYPKVTRKGNEKESAEGKKSRKKME